MLAFPADQTQALERDHFLQVLQVQGLQGKLLLKQFCQLILTMLIDLFVLYPVLVSISSDDK